MFFTFAFIFTDSLNLEVHRDCYEKERSGKHTHTRTEPLPFLQRTYKDPICGQAVAHTCNLSTLGGRDGRITWGQEFKANLTNMVKPRLYKNTKISQAWWCVSVITATWEAKVGESLESRRWTLLWDEIALLHSTLGDRPRHCLKKIKVFLYLVYCSTVAVLKFLIVFKQEALQYENWTVFYPRYIPLFHKY